jgi:hypothetical protein
MMECEVKESGNSTSDEKFFIAVEPKRDGGTRFWKGLEKFPVDFIAASVFAVMSAHWLAYESKKLLSLFLPPLALLVIALVLLLVLARNVYLGRFEAHRRVVFLELCGLFLLLDLASVSLHDVLPAKSLAVVFAGILVGSAYWVHHRREVLTRVRTLQVYEWQTLTEARKAAGEAEQILTHPSGTDLIVLLSIPSICPEVKDDSCEFKDSVGVAVRLERGMSVARAIDETGKLQTLNWQQLLRGIEPHARTVRNIYLTGSPNNSDRVPKAAPGPLSEDARNNHGSQLYAGECAAMLRLLLPEGVKIHHADAVDFKKVDVLDAAVSKLVKKISAGYASDERPEIVVETTGALKSTSIAGAIATLKGEARFQYVVTFAPYNVLLHDLRIDEPPQPG